MTWNLHWLKASGDLRTWQDQVTSEIEAAREVMSCLLPVPALDILVQRQSGAVIPEIGMVGDAYRQNLFALTLDPDNPNFSRCVSDGTLRRLVVHEAHHCLRIASQGYGRSLGEALVSEGLAGRFVSRVFATPPEPWEHAVGDDVLTAHLPGASELARQDYDHPGWFYGSGRLPRWLGYTLGYRIVGDWLADAADLPREAWPDVPAWEVLEAANGRTLGAR